MLIGTKSIFAIECEVLEILGNFIFGNFRFWANSESIGNWEDYAVVDGCVRGLNMFANKTVNRFEPGLAGMSREEIYYTLYESFMPASKVINKGNEPYENTFSRFNISELGMSSFDRYVVLLIEDGNQQRLVWHCVTDDIVREAYLPNGEMQRVAREFCDVMFNDPASAPLCLPRPVPAKKRKPVPVPTKAQVTRLANKDKLLGRLINFHMFPTDEVEFVQNLTHERVCVVAYDCSLAVAQPIAINTNGIDNNDTTVYLLREVDFHQLIYRNNTSDKSVVDINKSLVVEFVRCRQTGNALSRGRLYFTTGYYDHEGSWQDKPGDFLEWGNHLIRWIRTHYSWHHETGFHVSPHALKWAMEQGATLKTI